MGGGVTKNQYIEGNCLKRGGGPGQFADLSGRVGGLAKKRGRCFEGRAYAHYDWSLSLLFTHKTNQKSVRVQWHEISAILGRENCDGSSSSKPELEESDFGVRREKPTHYIP